jgi:hypothetical protein
LLKRSARRSEDQKKTSDGQATEEKYAETLQRLVEVLRERNDLKGELSRVKVELADYVVKNQQYQERVSRLEFTVAAQNSKEARLNFTALKGEVPILWIKATAGSIDVRQFNRLRDGICRMCPDIKLVLMTEGKTDLYELTDEDLNRMGLARITGIVPEAPTPVPDVPRLGYEDERA